MSGWIAIIGNGVAGQWRLMLDRIAHRGPDIGGWTKCKTATIGQNYLPADVGGDPGRIPVPLVDTSPAHHIIGFDGQITNWAPLAEQLGVGKGPYRQERILLRLHERYGAEMFRHLDDAIFTFIIADDNGVLAARDLLGIKTLFYGRKDDAVYLGSELKSVLAITDEVYEFPPGHYMDQSGALHPFASLPTQPPRPVCSDAARAIADIRRIIDNSLAAQVDFTRPTGSLLSGGIDSSVVAMLAARACRKTLGDDKRLKTFALGVGESEDIRNARLVADHIGADHHEMIIDLDTMLGVLDDVIYHLESFDPSLVRSAVSNYLISRHAREHGIEVLLSGEGGDEVFCGYLFLKERAPEEMFAGQLLVLRALHSNAALRLDRMNQCNGLRVVTPLISGDLLRAAMAMAPELKIRPNGNEKIEKWIFRQAYAGDLPEQITWRLKQEFSQGSGSAATLTDHFEKMFDDDRLAAAQAQCPLIRSKEELYYYNIFTRHFGTGHAVQTVGQWTTL